MRCALHVLLADAGSTLEATATRGMLQCRINPARVRLPLTGRVVAKAAEVQEGLPNRQRSVLLKCPKQSY